MISSAKHQEARKSELKEFPYCCCPLFGVWLGGRILRAVTEGIGYVST